MSYCSDWYHLIVFLVRPRLVTLSSLLLSLSLSAYRSHPVFIFFCLAILLAFCLLFSAMRQLLSDIGKLGCGCHTRAPKPNLCVLCVGVQRRELSLPDLPTDDGVVRRNVLKSIPTILPDLYYRSNLIYCLVSIVCCVYHVCRK